VAGSASAAANLATDAYIAAFALSWAASVATLDRDFRRFDGLRIIEPGGAR
jgi:predicted nucleic acid-binding protein